MRTKLEAIKWALAHIDEVIYFNGKRHRIVGVGLTDEGWVSICQVESGWISLVFDDCILSDLKAKDNDQFIYVSIDEIEEKWERKKV